MAYYFNANNMRVNLFYNNTAAKQKRFAFTVSSMDGKNENAAETNVNGLHYQYASCHNLPPKGHIEYQLYPISTCVSCHAGFVDIKGNIIEQTEGINGKVNVRGF
ncbi:MAG: hypothetical protein M1480_11555 [Bacteroidetes bacterium]|nr:hypothetical protein [Bacteroidota bacterium]